MEPIATEKPIGQLLSELTTNLGTLVHHEVELLQEDVKVRASNMKKDAIGASVAGAVLYLGSLALTAALILGLAQFVPAWASAAIVGVVLSVVGVALLAKVKKDVENAEFAPKTAMRSLKQDMNLVKEVAR